MKRAILPSLALLLIAATLVHAETRLVPGDYETIQQAISACNDGDVVIVEPGRYVENINFLGRDIVVTGTDPNDLEIVAATIIDGDGQGSVVTFENQETSEAVLTGFTIREGNGTRNIEMETTVTGIRTYVGAGVYCLRSSPTITRNVITHNRGALNLSGPTQADVVICCGGGIGGYDSAPTITHNIIRDNSAYAGGGIICYIGEATVGNNVIYENSSYIGGGIFLYGTSSVHNNTIVGNDCGLADGDGIAGNVYIASMSDPGPHAVANNIICDAKSGGGILLEGILSDASYVFNNVWGNLPGNYVGMDPQTGQLIYDGVDDRTGEGGNISKDPLFVDPRSDDYHLQVGSPCISGGDPDFVPEPGQTDMDGNPRIYAVRVDMGAYEFVGYVNPVANAGPDQHVPEIQLVTLDASGSFIYDPCGIVMYEWDQLMGPAVELDNPTSMHPTFMPQFEGEYQFELIIIDGENMSQPDEVLILVGNEAPIADAGPNRVMEFPGIVRLNGTGSYDPDAIDEITYTWKQLEGPEVVLENENTATPSFYCDERGIYVFELVVSDGFVDSEPSVVQVTTVTATINQRSLDAGYATEDYFHYPDVSGSMVVYSVGPGSDNSWDIRVKDLDTDIVDDKFAVGGIDTQPKIDGDIVVWAGGPTATGLRGPECISIFARNVVTGAQNTLREHSNTESYSHPAVSANKVVWLEHLDINKHDGRRWHDMPYSICGADITDLDTPIYFTIAKDVGRRDPYPYETYSEDFDDVIDISEDIVVWEAEGDIYGADISNIDDIRVFAICSDPARQFDPAVSGNLVVWTDERNDEGDIYGADISDINDIREVAIVRGPGSQQQPAIDACLIVCVDGNVSGGQIRTFCLTKQLGVMDIQLTAYYFGVGPAIQGDSIIWQTSTYGVQGITIEFAYSPADGPIENVNTGKRYDYIQHAIISGQAGDTIEVAEGTYHEDINFKGKGLTVTSTDPTNPDVVAATVIDGSSRVVTFSNSENPDSVLSGFTITGGGRGIYCSYGATPTIVNCIITGHIGAGISLYSRGNPTVTNCSITANAGHGIEMYPRTTPRLTYYNYPKVTNCVIAGNCRPGIFGGIPTITNCTIVGNVGCAFENSRPTITNSIICHNGGSPDTAQMKDCTATITCSNVQGFSSGIGNIDTDPCFASPCCWVDASDPNIIAGPDTPDIIFVEGDYHLKSEAGRWDPTSRSWVIDDVSSPCIDAGDPNSCIGFEPNPNSSMINMGAYGGTAQASKSPSGVSCISADHPDYGEWVKVGEPVCWCYQRQCHADADCKSQTSHKYWVSTDDLDLVIAAWNKPFSEIEGVKVSGLDLVCADFDHKAEGRKAYRVSTDDLDILIANWNTANKPDPDCP